MNPEQDPIAYLAEQLALQADVLASQTAQQSVWACAVLALVRTHPDPSAFAAEFHRCWRKAGDQQSNDQAGEAARNGYAETLAHLEQACRVPLGVRPPGVARRPQA